MNASETWVLWWAGRNRHLVIYYSIFGVFSIIQYSPLWQTILYWEYVLLGGVGGLNIRVRGLRLRPENRV